MTLSVRSVKRSLLVTVIAAGVCAPPAGAASLGGLTQLGGTSSCVTGDGSRVRAAACAPRRRRWTKPTRC